MPPHIKAAGMFEAKLDAETLRWRPLNKLSRWFARWLNLDRIPPGPSNPNPQDTELQRALTVFPGIEVVEGADKVEPGPRGRIY